MVKIDPELLDAILEVVSWILAVLGIGLIFKLAVIFI